MFDRSEIVWFFLKTKGRIGRQTYILGNLLLGVIQTFVLYRAMIEPERSSEQQFWVMIFWLLFILFLWPNLVMTVKRLHDLGQSGFLALSLFVPVLSIMVFLVLCLLPGKIKGNRFRGQTDSHL